MPVVSRRWLTVAAVVLHLHHALGLGVRDGSSSEHHEPDG
jgi:hypothetical protein